MNTFKARLVSILMFASLLLAALPISNAKAFGAVYRVTPTGGMFGRRCGSNWATACSLPFALASAGEGDAIWAAAGTYKPTTGTDRTITFTLKNGVALYGGFAGNETALEQRAPNVNVTILSGNIGDSLSRYDNSYHVIVTSGTGDTTILDGVTITGGQSDGTSPYDKGAGLLNLNGSPTLRNLTFSANNTGNAYGDGAGMYSTGDPTLTHVVFSGNSTGSYGHGGGMYSNGQPLIMDVTFSNNWACVGGGLYSEGRPIVTNVTFSGNQAANGAGMYNYGDTDFTNVTFSGNTAMFSGGGLETGSGWDLSSPTLTNVTFSGNRVTSATSGKGGAINGYNSNIVIHNSILWGNMAATGPEINQAGNQSINIIYSVVEGGCPAGGICAHVYTGDPRLGELGNYGGFTQTIRLLRGSPAIDQALDASCPFTDQRGIARPQGKRCDIGAYEVLGPVKPGIYDDTHPAWTYTGTWDAIQGTGTYNDTLHHTRTRESYAEVTFNGVQVQLMYMTGPDRGAIDVYIDGQYVATIDANTLLPSQAAWTSPVWDAGVHTVRFQAVGRGAVDIDGIQVSAAHPVVGVGTYDDTDAAWSYTGSWVTYSSSGPYNNTLHYTNVVGDAAQLLFHGTGFTLTYSKANNRGLTEVYVDNVLVGTIDAYSSTTQWQQTYTSPTFASGDHIVRFIHAGGGTYIDIDAIQIIDGPVAVPPGTYDDMDAAWTYTGAWITYSGSGPYNGTLHYTNVIGDSAQVVFHGSQFTLTYSKAATRGSIGVYVDNVQVGTINAYSSSTLWQQTWTSPTFTSGDHTVRFVYASGGTYIDVDAITIFP